MNPIRMITTTLFLGIFCLARAQNPQADSLKAVIEKLPDNSEKVNSIIALSGSLLATDTKLALNYANEAKSLANKIHFKDGQGYAQKAIGMAYYFQSDFVEALIHWQLALADFEETGNKVGISNMLNNLGAVYFNQGGDEQALQYYLKSLNVAEESGDKVRIATALLNIGAVYFNKESTHDLALEYYLKALPLSEAKDDKEVIGTVAVNIGEIYLARGDDDAALTYFNKSLEAYKKSENGNVPYVLYNIGKVYTHRQDFETAINYQTEAYNLANSLNRKKEMAQAKLGLANIYRLTNENEQAILAFHKAEEIAKEIDANYELKDAYEGLAKLYSELTNFKLAFQYQNLYAEIKDTLYNAETDKRIQSMVLKSELSKKKNEITLLEKDKQQQIQQTKNQRLFIFSITGALLSALLIIFILYRNNKSRQKSMALLKKQKKEIQDALEKLRETQSQLIHSEKMASLGELTAGIAHEIENPLNFINNFSEISKELMEEMMVEVKDGNLAESEVIAKDLIENLEKINSHGKRADGIVKAMLQHSRTNSGKKELTDINALAGEFMRISYHGLKAKDKTFNAEFELTLDEELPKINLNQQEFGRVLHNLINNAFYSVSEKAKSTTETYIPTVWLFTHNSGGKIEITIKDNGTGIPKAVKDKIFQPFFTTKPTGQGTGLGLSLSYDIVKAHGGELIVETEEGKGTEFIITL